MPERGELWLAALDPVGPDEQGGTRPVLVVSTDAFDAWPVGLVIVVPITTGDRGFAHHVLVAGGGLDRPSFAVPEYVRSVSQRRLRRRIGTAEDSTLVTVDDWLRRVTGQYRSRRCRSRNRLPSRLTWSCGFLERLELHVASHRSSNSVMSPDGYRSRYAV